MENLFIPYCNLANQSMHFDNNFIINSQANIQYKNALPPPNFAGINCFQQPLNNNNYQTDAQANSLESSNDESDYDMSPTKSAIKKRRYREGLEYSRITRTRGHNSYFRWSNYPKVLSLIEEYNMNKDITMNDLKDLYNDFITMYPKYDVNSRNVRRNKSCLVCVFNDHISEFRQFLRVHFSNET